MSDAEEPSVDPEPESGADAAATETLDEGADSKPKRAMISRRAAVGMMAGGVVVGAVGSRIGADNSTGGDLDGLISERGYKGNWAKQAVQTFVPPGEFDPYFIFASGGHSGQVLVFGAPSMRLLKVIPVFTRDAWQGYGFGTDQGEKVLTEGSDPAKSNLLGWGDTHHPALSETDGDYDGRWLYINDRANGRIAMVDLTDFKTKQIIDLPNLGSSHGGCFVTPNSEYVHISSMTPAPYLAPDGYAPLSEYRELYRGASCWLAIDQETGRIDMDKSFQIELPPYTQDLADAGKLTSFGFGFINSYNTEMATGGTLEDPKNALESSAIANDFDFMHMIDWQKAEEVFKAGGTEDMNGVAMIRLDTAIEEGILHMVPEPRNPHGVDVSPTGDYIVVSGKLDPHASIFSIEKLKRAIADKDYDGTDEFGVPILKMESCLEAQVELGNGPLHSQFDDKGNAYTSLFVDSAVAKWTLGPKAGVAEGQTWKKVDTLPVNYNIGHLCAAEGDTVNPDGKYLVALNKWSIDRFPPVGTLHPQNFQLIDLDGQSMEILSDTPIGVGEPHYTQMIKSDKLVHTIRVYEPGTDPMTMARSPFATDPGQERIERDGSTVDVYMTVMRSHTTPDQIEANEGDTVRLHLSNIETTVDATHGFAIPAYNIEASLDAGEVVNIEFEANRAGAFGMYCSEFCSALHLEMQGWFMVAP